MKISSATYILISTFLLNSCVSNNFKTVSQQNSQSRSVADSNSDSEIEFENKFQALFNEPNAPEMAVKRLEKLFVLLLKADQFINDFDSELNNKIAQKKANPTIAQEEPLQSSQYKNLLKVWNLKERYSEEIEYMYTRILEIRTNVNSSKFEHDQSRNILHAIEKNLRESQNLKKVEFQPLLAELDSIYKTYLNKYNLARKNQNPNNPSVKNVGALTSKTSFDNAIIKNPKVLNQATKDFSNPKIINSTISASNYKQHLDEIEGDLRSIEEPVFENREPKSLQKLDCVDGKKLCVGTGENGNIVGAIFPKGVWAFTYDDGPAAQSTSDMLDLFINYKDSVNPKGKATFFWQAKNVLINGKWIKKALDNGFPIANHSFSHLDLNKQTSNERYRQVVTSNQVIENEIHKYDPNYKIQYFRCPYGSCYAPKVPEVRQLIAKQNQIHVYWRIDSLDWKLLNGTKVADLVKKQMQLLDHGVILMHDIHPTTVEATRQVLSWMKIQNDTKRAQYKMVTIPQAVDLVNGQ